MITTVLIPVLPTVVQVIQAAPTPQYFFKWLQLFYELDGFRYETLNGNPIFDPGVFALQQFNRGFGLVIFVAFCIFYIVKKRPQPGQRGLSSQINQEVGNQMALFCPTCGTAAGDGAYCSNCGSSLGSASSQPVQQIYVHQPLNTIPRTSPMAVTALIVSFFISWIGLILGYVARKEIRESKGTLTGEGLAQAAIIIGWIWTILGVIVGIIWGVAIGISAGNSYSN